MNEREKDRKMGLNVEKNNDGKSKETIVSFNFCLVGLVRKRVMQIESSQNSLNRTIYSLYILNEY